MFASNRQAFPRGAFVNLNPSYKGDIEDYFDSDSPTSPNEPEEMILKYSNGNLIPKFINSSMGLPKIPVQM